VLLFFLGQLETVVFFSAKLCLLDRVDRLIHDVWYTFGDTQHGGEHRKIHTVNFFVDLRNVGLVFILKILDGLYGKVFLLGFRHKLDTIDSISGVEPRLQ